MKHNSSFSHSAPDSCPSPIRLLFLLTLLDDRQKWLREVIELCHVSALVVLLMAVANHIWPAVIALHLAFRVVLDLEV